MNSVVKVERPIVVWEDGIGLLVGREEYNAVIVERIEANDPPIRKRILFISRESALKLGQALVEFCSDERNFSEIKN